MLILDEPVLALDVSVQAQVPNLLVELKDAMALSYVIISHDLGVVRHVADYAAVMYLSKVVEFGQTHDLFISSAHPYMRVLVSATLRLTGNEDAEGRVILEGDLPSPIDVPGGCSFHTRCPILQDDCMKVEPMLYQMERDKSVACRYWLDKAESLQSHTGSRRVRIGAEGIDR